MAKGYHKNGEKFVPPSQLGRESSVATKQKLSDAKTGEKNPNYGKKFLESSASKRPNWKGGISKNPSYRSWSKNQRNRMKRVSEGSHTFAEWELLKAQYNWTCPCCGKSEPIIQLTEDHIIPVSRGGSDNIENIQPLCQSCNCKKHNKIIKY